MDIQCPSCRGTGKANSKSMQDLLAMMVGFIISIGLLVKILNENWVVIIWFFLLHGLVTFLLSISSEKGEKVFNPLGWFWSEKWRFFSIILLVILCIYIGHDRYQMQKQILKLERALDNKVLQEDMQDIREFRRARE